MHEAKRTKSKLLNPFLHGVQGSLYVHGEEDQNDQELQFYV